MKLSLLVPSNRPEGLEALRKSLELHSVCAEQWELVVLVDDELESVQYHHGYTEIHYPPKKPLSIAHLLHECYKMSRGEWIMFGNDDIICETPKWDKMVLTAIEQFGKDGMEIFWPDDNMFGINLACFPIVSRKLLDMVGFFPQPYQRYKVDDTLFGLFPPDKKYFLSNIKFRHTNDQGTEGYVLAPGKIYPILQEAARFDNERWAEQASNRFRMRDIVNKNLGIMGIRVFVALMTKEEGGRRADFYDNYDLIKNPPGIQCFRNKAHGQSPARGRNMLIQQALDANATHILFLDDDVYPPENVISQLLAHDKDIVSGLYYSRSYPHKPYIFREGREDGSCVWGALRDDETGLIPIVAAGLGVCLVKTTVFHKMEQPWIRLGEYELDQWCDDIGFFNRARAAGFEIFCDLNCQAGHSFSGIIWPMYAENRWLTSIDTKGDARVTFQQITEKPVEV